MARLMLLVIVEDLVSDCRSPSGCHGSMTDEGRVNIKINGFGHQNVL